MPQEPNGRLTRPKVCYFCGNLSRENLGEWRPPRTLEQVKQGAVESACQGCLVLCWIASDFVSGTRKPGTVISSMRFDSDFELSEKSDSPVTLLLDLSSLENGAEVQNKVSLQMFSPVCEYHSRPPPCC